MCVFFLGCGFGVLFDSRACFADIKTLLVIHFFFVSKNKRIEMNMLVFFYCVSQKMMDLWEQLKQTSFFSVLSIYKWNVSHRKTTAWNWWFWVRWILVKLRIFEKNTIKNQQISYRLLYCCLCSFREICVFTAFWKWSKHQITQFCWWRCSKHRKNAFDVIVFWNFIGNWVIQSSSSPAPLLRTDKCPNFHRYQRLHQTSSKCIIEIFASIFQ